jgi:erythromycin 12 hydroxylase
MTSPQQAPSAEQVSCERDVPPEVEPDGGRTLLAWLDHMREHHPVWRDENGHYHVFRHADVTSIIADPATFSSDTVTRLSGGAESPPGGTLLLLDPPRHSKLRRIVTQAFSARQVSALDSRIGEIAADLLDAIGKNPASDPIEVDLVDAFANPLPVTVIAELLGVPFSDLDRFQGWANCLLTDTMDDPEGAKRLEATVSQMHEYLQMQTTERRASPRDDLLSTLVLAEVEGESLNDHDVISFGALLLLAGHVTTAVLLGNTLLCLDENPEQMAAVRADFGHIPAVLEEVLRVRPPFLKVERVTTSEVELGGQHLPENAMIYLWLLAANRDERVFDDPDAFRPGRANAKHTAFGHGIHYCLGAPLARMEGRIGLELMLSRFSDLRVRRDVTLSWHGANVFGARHLPLNVRRG